MKPNHATMHQPRRYPHAPPTRPQAPSSRLADNQPTDAAPLCSAQLFRDWSTHAFRQIGRSDHKATPIGPRHSCKLAAASSTSTWTASMQPSRCANTPNSPAAPLAVGGASGRGVLTTCNYPAREYGVRSAMPVFKAKQLCPQLSHPARPLRTLPRRVARHPRDSSSATQTSSNRSRSTKPTLTSATTNAEAPSSPKEIRAAIHAETGLTASAGIGTQQTGRQGRQRLEQA